MLQIRPWLLRCLNWCLVATRGWAVRVFERRARPSEDQPSTSHQYPMVLTSRGTRVIRATGAAPAMLDPGRQSLRTTFLIAPGKAMMTPSAASPGDTSDPSQAFVVDRTTLTAQLVAAAEALHPAPAITFHFEHALASIDFGARRAVFNQASASGDGSCVEAEYDLLVGADGGGSRTRELMQASV